MLGWLALLTMLPPVLCLRKSSSLSAAKVSHNVFRKTSPTGPGSRAYTLLNKLIIAESVVCKGYGRGSKKLGYPTANLPQFDKELATHCINRGIYFGWCRIGKEIDIFPCVTNIGISPTFVGQENAVNIIESYVLHRNIEQSDFYGEPFRLALVGYIRPEMKFSDLESLIAQIKEDVALTEQTCQELAHSTVKWHSSSVSDGGSGCVSIKPAPEAAVAGAHIEEEEQEQSRRFFEGWVMPTLRAGEAELASLVGGRWVVDEQQPEKKKLFGCIASGLIVC